MAGDYIKRAGRCLREATSAFTEGDYPITVRRSQECVELSLKAVLRGLGIEYPREHEVSGALGLAGERLPPWFSAEIPRLIAISKDLSKKRGPALYGYEEELIPASELFEQGDAEVALAAANEVFQLCERVVEVVLKEGD
jgi:HEPN domain-containing protein